MDEKIVVKGDVKRIVETLLKDSSDDLFWPYLLLSIAVDLCPERSTRQIKEGFFKPGKRFNKAEALTKIMEEWVKESGQSAKLDKLILMLCSNGLEISAAKAKSLLLLVNNRSKNEAMETDTDVNTEAITEAEGSTGLREGYYGNDNDTAPNNLLLSSSSQEVMGAQERALSNSVILEEIFKKLHFKDRKEFRLVNQHWLKHTFPFWRRSARIRVLIGISLGNLWDHSTVSIEEFLELSRNTVDKGAIGINKENLEEHPFRSFAIFHNVFVPPKGNISEKRKNDAESFWKLVGPEVKHLKLNTTLGRNMDVVERLLIQTCPKLEELHINVKTARAFDIDLGDWRNAGGIRDYAKNLRKLTLSGRLVKAQGSQKILNLCPNLKTLVIPHEGYLGGLLIPTVTGEFIKLQKLVTSSTMDDLILLRNYVDLPEIAIQHLELIDGIELADARTAPLNLYAALGKCSSSLKTLKLYIHNLDNADAAQPVTNLWFMDLSLISFPNLTKLIIEFDTDEERKFFLRFDFGTLRNMPNLEELKLDIEHELKHRLVIEGRSLEQFYLYRGRRDLYLPHGVATVGNPVSQREPLEPCTKLKRLSFNGWPLYAEDVRLFAGWFPNLTYLKTSMCTSAYSILLESWEKLQTLHLGSSSTFSLKQLRNVKLKREYVTVTQDIKRDFPKVFVGKGPNGDIVIEELSTSSGSSDSDGD